MSFLIAIGSAALVLIGSPVLAADGRTEGKWSVVATSDKEWEQFLSLAHSFFSGVKNRDVRALARLGRDEERDYLIERAVDRNPEFEALFVLKFSPGTIFSNWSDFRWVAARDLRLEGHGDGALLCLADKRTNLQPWPPTSAQFDGHATSHQMYCVFTSRQKDRRIISFGFVYPEEGV